MANIIKLATGLTWQTTAMICMILLCGSLFVYVGGNLTLDITIEQRVQEIEDTLWTKINSTYAALAKPYGFVVLNVTSGATQSICLVRGNDSKLLQWSTNDDWILQQGINNASVKKTSLFICSHAFSATVTLKDGGYYIADYGVTGITFNVNAGANCTLDNRQTGLKYVYENGIQKPDSFPYSYTVYKTGSNYYAKNMTTNMVEFGPTTNASYVTNSVSLKIAGIEGTAFVKCGVYSMRTTTIVYENCSWLGEDMKGVTFTRTVDVPLFTVSSATSIRHVNIQNIQLNGNGTGFVQPLVYFKNIVAAYVANIRLTNFARHGLVVDGTSGTYYSYYNTWENIYLSVSIANNGAIFYFNGTNGDNTIRNVMGSGNSLGITGLWMLKGGSLYVYDFHPDRTKNVVFVNTTANIGNLKFENMYVDLPTDHGIVLECNTPNVLSDVQIIGLRHIGMLAGKDIIHLNLTASIYRLYIVGASGLGSDNAYAYILAKYDHGTMINCLFENNRLPAGQSGSYYNITTGGAIIKNDVTFITEKTGNFTQSSRESLTETVAHGLSLSPDFIQIVGYNSTKPTWYLVSKDATNFVITFSTGGSGAWSYYVEGQP